jgi:VWFA-related protein
MRFGRAAVAVLPILLSAGLMASPTSRSPNVGQALTPAGPAESPPDTIRLDAIVTDRSDHPIRDLKTSDFEISDNGQNRPVDSATLESGRDGRLIAIFLDDYHVEAGDSARARTALTQFIDSELRPNDLVAVMKPLDSLKAIQVTEDRRALRSAIETFEGRKGDYAPRTPLEENLMSRAPAAADVGRSQVVSSALQALALRIGAMRDGRKTIVLVSEGFAPPASRGSDSLTGSLRGVVYAANRYGVAIYPIDPRMPSTGNASDQTMSPLQSLANQTGGEATINEADLIAGMEQSARDLDSYYELSYRPGGEGDGKFHPVGVRVKRPGAQIRARSGYWAPSAAALRLAAGPMPRAMPMATKAPHVSTLIHPWFGTSRGPDGLTTVIVTWEPGSAPPRNQHIGSVVLKATADDGRVLFQDRVDSRAAFDAPPGHIQLDMTIQGIDGKTLDSDYRGMDVPNLRVSRPTIATPQILRTRNAREFAAESVRLDVAPVAAREFSRTERLIVRIPVYPADDSAPTVTVTLTNRAGTPIESLSRVPAALPAGIVQFDLPLARFPPEDYRIEVVATSPASPEAKTVILFRITN